MAAYSATKFAIRGLTQSAALELGAFGITVNAYAPGAIQTEMLDSMADIWQQNGRGSSHEMLTMLSKMASAGRNGTPEDVASLVSYLASKESHFITGQSIIVDGGVKFD